MRPAPAFLARNRIIRRWTRGLWVALLKARHGDRVVQERMELRLELDLTNPIDKYVAAFDAWENDRLEYLLATAVELDRPDVSSLFVDVGAHWGLYSLRAWKTGMFDRIVAFEPEPARARQFRANMRLNDVGAEIELIEAAASDVAGTLGLGREGRITSDAAEHARAIEAVVPDGYFEARDTLVIAKIDVEGFETRALRGLHGLLTGNRGFVQVEIWAENEAGVLPLMDSLGYGRIHAIGHDHYFTNF